jgi:hypothetical protein
MSPGVTSYTPAFHAGVLARIDLQERDTRSAVLTATGEQSSVARLLGNAEVFFDSAIQASRGCCRWIDRRLFSERIAVCGQYTGQIRLSSLISHLSMIGHRSAVCPFVSKKSKELCHISPAHIPQRQHVLLLNARFTGDQKEHIDQRAVTGKAAS